MVAGASGFVCKSEPAEVILRAIECVQRGEIWLNRNTTAKVMASLWERGNGESTHASHAALTSAERKVIATVAKYKGAPNKVLAETLHISAHTLRNHLASIYEKLGVHKRVELVFYAMENGLDVEVTAPRPTEPRNSGPPHKSSRADPAALRSSLSGLRVAHQHHLPRAVSVIASRDAGVPHADDERLQRTR